MDIYTVLTTKKHNKHYLNRYITFIERCQEKNKNFTGYVEKHHICPKAKDMFPEYKNFKDHPWNLAILTARQHFLAHWILARAYGGGMWVAFFNMSVCKTTNQQRTVIKNSRIYEEIRKNLFMSEETKNKISKSMKGKKNSLGRKLSDDTKEKISKSNKERKRIITDTERETKSIKMSKKIWCNDGNKNKRFEEEEIPKNWVRGRVGLKRSKGGKWQENRKQRRSYVGEDNPAAKKVFAAGKIYNSVKEAAEKTNCTTPTVRNRCKKEKYKDWYYL